MKDFLEKIKILCSPQKLIMIGEAQSVVVTSGTTSAIELVASYEAIT
jgi:hypothetical protein